MGFVCVRIGCKVGLADGWNGKSATSAQICFLIEIEGGEDKKAVVSPNAPVCPGCEAHDGSMSWLACIGMNG